MSDADLALFRCPLDPQRQSLLHRDRDVLACDRCSSRFPVKNGLPILLADEVELPDGVKTRRDLPCHRR